MSSTGEFQANRLNAISAGCAAGLLRAPKSLRYRRPWLMVLLLPLPLPALLRHHWLFTLQHHTLPLYPLFGRRVLGRDCAEASVTASSDAVPATNTIIFIVALHSLALTAPIPTQLPGAPPHSPDFSS
jgi:hypothetical protein